MSSAFLIVGLGNPGPKYAETRHNAGFWFLDELTRSACVLLKSQSRLQAESVRTSLAGHDSILARPTTFMNRSGAPVRALLDYYKIAADKMLVAYDDLDLPPGVIRLKQGGGHGGHNGLRDIFNHVENRDFLRLRIGIGHPGHKDAVTRYVLGRSPKQVREVVDTAIARAVAALPLVLDGRVQEAMTRLHSTNP
ncbi:MAG: aminoacyl-tRNA hydrolase [Gammaproteobacteria bacterium]|nr:aminoacyl-tRNA hydrolase [Gammaproteobacteria bacterium]